MHGSLQKAAGLFPRPLWRNLQPLLSSNNSATITDNSKQSKSPKYDDIAILTGITR